MIVARAILFAAIAIAWAQTGPPPPALLFRGDWNHKEPFEAFGTWSGMRTPSAVRDAGKASDDQRFTATTT